jgi:hypothetical protein
LAAPDGNPRSVGPSDHDSDTRVRVCFNREHRILHCYLQWRSPEREHEQR